jgi:hypothetical protein
LLMVISSDFIDIRISRERTDHALQGLEKLKSIVSLVESRYAVLEEDYVAVLDDAISRVQKFRAELEKVNAVQVKNDLISNTGGLPEKELLNRLFDVKLEKIEEILPAKSVKKDGASDEARGLQSIVDIVGDALELGLDKIGNGITLPVDSVLKLVQSIKKSR